MICTSVGTTFCFFCLNPSQYRAKSTTSMTSESLFDLVRFDTKSSIDSNATAPNLPGPGRTVGLLFDWLGTRLENVLNNRVSNLRHDPDTIAQNIRQLCRHNERSIVQRHHSPRFDLTAVEKKHLKKLCNKLIKSAARCVTTT